METCMKGDSMRLSGKWFLVFFSALFVIVDVAFCADVAKIGVIDFQRVIADSDRGKDIKAQMLDKGKAMESDFKKKVSEIVELKKRLEREAMVMSKEMRQDKERELRIKEYDAKVLQKKYNTDIQAMEKQLMGPHLKAIKDIVDEIGKTEGYLVILEKTAALYSPSTIDITDTVVKRYNAAYAKTKNN